MQAYHDTEWGVPQHDDRALFELLILEGAQAGLSWRTILARRQAYRDAFHDFDIARVAGMRMPRWRAADILRHHPQPAESVLGPRQRPGGAARAGGPARWTPSWAFVDGAPVVNRWTDSGQVPATTPLSDRMSKDLRKAGFNFVGSTICYSFMQATGMVNDHLTTCFRHARSPRTHAPCRTPKRSGAWSTPSRNLSSRCPTASGACRNCATGSSAPAPNTPPCWSSRGSG